MNTPQPVYAQILLELGSALLDFVSQIKRAGGKPLIKTFRNNNYDNALSPNLKQLSARTYFGQRGRESRDRTEPGPASWSDSVPYADSNFRDSFRFRESSCAADYFDPTL